MRSKKVCDNVCLCRFMWSFFKATTLPREGSCGRSTLDLSPGSRPTLKRELMVASFAGSHCL